MAHGIHHVTAIAGPARRNLDFYTRVLGQRFVKKTVNFDDPGTYHFYFGDEAGNPGTIMTFFPWEHAAPGRLGIGETQETGYRVPKASLGFWTHRFIEQGVVHEKLEQRFGQTVLPFKDPDGMRLALVGVEDIEHEAAWAAPGIPAEHALRGFHGVTLLLDKIDATAAVLTDVFGFEQQAKEGYVTRYHVPGTDIGGVVDLRAAGEFLPARPGAYWSITLPSEQKTMPNRLKWLKNCARITACRQQNRKTGIISARSISVLQVAYCSKLPRSTPALPSMNPQKAWGRH